MKNRTFFLLLIAFLICNITYAQDTNPQQVELIDGELIKRVNPYSKIKYIYGEKIYKRKQLGEVLVNDKLAWNFYKKYQERKRREKRNGIITGGFVSITLLTSTIIPISVGANDGPKTNNDICFEYAIVPIFSTLGALLSGATSFVSRMSANRSFDKSVRFFNGNVKNKESIGMHPIDLNLKYSQDGIGLVLNF